MNYNELIGRIQAILSAVPGVGRVHTSFRYAREPENFQTLFYYDGSIRAWIISRESISAQWSASQGNTLLHRFRLIGYLSSRDSAETEIEFQQILDDVLDAFRPQSDLNGYCEIHRPIQVESIGYRSFSGQLCHFAECVLEVQEYTM